MTHKSSLNLRFLCTLAYEAAVAHLHTEQTNEAQQVSDVFTRPCTYLVNTEVFMMLYAILLSD